jgi:hypothetical protein
MAALHPQPDIPASVRALPVVQPALPDAQPAVLDVQPAMLGAQLALPTPQPALPDPQPALTAAPPIRRAVVSPIAPKRYLLKVTLGEETHAKLQRTRALLRHVVPDGDVASILDRALTLLLREAERTKWAATRRPRSSRGTSVTRRHVPASVKRVVWERDAGCCAFVGPAGRCGETGFLEFHHVTPFSVGGRTDADNLELRCRAHNQHEAVTALGPGSAAGVTRTDNQTRARISGG